MKTYLVKKEVVLSIPLKTISELIPLIVVSYIMVYQFGKSKK